MKKKIKQVKPKTTKKKNITKILKAKPNASILF
jgi:hypothetical protein